MGAAIGLNSHTVLAWRNTRAGWGLLTRGQRTRWALLVPLGLLSALLEAAATATVFALAALITNGNDARVVAQLDRLQAYAPGLSGRPQDLLPLFLALAAFLFLIKAAVTFLTILYNNKIAARDQARFAASMFRGFLRLPYVLHFGRHATDFTHRVRQSVETVFGLILWHTLNIARNLMAIAGLALVLLLANPLLTTILGVIVASWLFLLTLAFRTYYVRLGRGGDELKRQRERILYEGLGALQEIQMLGRESYFADRFEALEQGLIETRYKDATAVALPRVLNELVFVLAMIAVVGLTASGPGRLSSLLPLLGLYAYAGLRMLPAGNSIVESINQISGATHPLAKLLHDQEVIRRHAVEPDTGNGAELAFRDRLELHDVSYSFPGAARPALDGISLVISRGSCVAIVGSTGAGKSTLVSLLAGIITPTHGQLLIDGDDLGTRCRLWQKQIGYVPQLPFLTDENVRRNIALGVEDADIDGGRIDTAVRLAGLEAVIARLPRGLDSQIGQHGRNLSGGQRQRLAIARALYSDPALLLFDEAMSALDPETETEVIDIIRRLRGVKTIVVISHRFQFARHADTVILLDEGRVAASGTWDELSAGSERFRRLVGHG